jgi:Flp pilus assembly pilin Flp
MYKYLMLKSRKFLRDDSGQGVSEYIIILAVIVIAAIVLAIAFYDQLSAVWDSVTSGLGDLS